MKEYIFPVGLVESSHAAGVENLLTRQILQIGLMERTTAEFEKGGHVILDYGQELCGGAQGMSTFMSYYILTAVASFDKAAAIDMMKTYYGAMLNMGATTFWEDFDLRWTENACRIDRFPAPGQRDIHGDFGAFCYKGFRHSLCHGWSAGVLQFIQENCE